eukprot:TRINITY_DN193_c0_g7_i2.p1 TRINITY_DN193_c0_g7~~TRINITY_DN193_c0_g7_i2.p1  ORF type:complete len:137 (+),score=17.82 TRINITY_DN193_c0_g7_i2:51-461(+)
MGGNGSRLIDDSMVEDNLSSRAPWKMGTVENTMPHYKHFRGAQPGELQHPALKHCRSTRMYRDQCLSKVGNCEYKIEAHFQCLEQYYPKDRVQKLRDNFRDQAYENYNVIDNLMARAPYYYMGDFCPNIASHSMRM